MKIINRILCMFLGICMIVMNCCQVMASENDAVVQYFYMSADSIEVNTTMDFAISFETVEDSVSLQIVHSGKKVNIEPSVNVENAYKFEYTFTECDDYTVESVTVDGNVIDLADIGMDVTFTVEEEGISEEASYSEDEEGIVSVDGEDSIEELAQTISQEVSYSADSEFIICLDPGHGGQDSGSYTVDSNVYEKTLNLKLALYLRDYLEQYDGIKVVMTRTTDVYLGTEDMNDLKARAYIAYQNNADLFISIHQNAFTGTTQGAMVFYPNRNYNANVSYAGQYVATSILKELTALGIQNLGIQTRDIDEDGADWNYADGSRGDYYGIIRHAKKYGITGMIIEHCFCDNYSDYYNYLSTDEKLQALARADCEGILKGIGYGNYTNWRYQSKKWYYYENGSYVTDWKKISGTWYYFNEDGTMRTGWLEDDDGYTYYLGSFGTIQTGWVYDSGFWYYLDGEGHMQTGWITVDNHTYYLKESGQMVVGVQVIDGKTYIFGADGSLQNSDNTLTGWVYSGNQWFYFNSDGTAQTGWKEIDSVQYYFNESGVMATGFKSIDGKTYYFNQSGAMLTGWQKMNGNWYWFNSDGSTSPGTKEVNGITYVFDENGMMRTGWYKYNGDWYYTNSSGAMVTGWIQLSGTWYYLNEDGKMACNGTKEIGNATYCFNASGAMITGWGYVDGNWYYATSSGALVTGWIRLGGTWYYLNEDGKMATGWKKVDGTWYYMNASGAMLTGWIQLSGTWYYLNASGEMLTGWQKINGVWYYFTNDGNMVTGEVEIDGAIHLFESSGAWVKEVRKAETGMYEIMGTSSVTVNQMVAYFNASNKNYDVYAKYDTGEYDGCLATGGASTIEEFCQIFYEEANAEGVKAEVAFAQAMLETGYLQFGGDVKPNQYNFAGLGATGGVPGNSFNSVREGIRAQIQHLKCYASTEALNNECVDQRWWDALRGTAPYVEYLQISNNPSGYGWAASTTYAQNLLNMISALKSM